MNAFIIVGTISLSASLLIRLLRCTTGSRVVPIGCLVAMNADSRKEKIQALQKLVRGDDFLSKFPYDDEPYLERFLGGTGFNVEEAFDRIKTYYELLMEFPEWFTREAPLSKKDLIEKQMRVALSDMDNDGRPIYIVKIGNIDPSKMSLLDVVAVDDIWIESILLKFASENGLCVLIDIANLPWRSLKWLTPYNIKIGVKKLLCLPFKDYRFHVVNDSMLVHAAIKVLWPFLPNHLKEMVKFHFNDRESLHSFIDPDKLPKEYGGTNTDICFDSICDRLFAQNQQIFDSFQTYRNC